jgi:hypothetical protein
MTDTFTGSPDLIAVDPARFIEANAPSMAVPHTANLQSRWHRAIPWILTVSATLALIAIGWFLVANVEWFKSRAVADAYLPEYRMDIFHLHLSMIKRSVGLFSGFAIMFLGLGVAFYTADQTRVDVGTPTIKAKLATASPGIIAMLIGMTMILFTINSKDTFHEYRWDRSSSGSSSSEIKQPAPRP